VRGCLSVLLLAAIFVAAVTWFVGPALAAGLVTAALASAGFTSAERTVTVEAHPPLTLLVAHADSVRIEATGVSFSGIHAGTMDATLDDVSLLDRTFARIDLRLGDATVRTGGSDVLLSRIDVAGPARNATAQVALPTVEVASLIEAKVRTVLPVAPTTVRISAPDVVTIEVLGQQLTTRLGVDAQGRLVLEPAGGGIVEAVLFDPSTVPGLTLVHVSASDQEVVVDGFADVTRLLP
jgi:hypothetical protein